MVEFDPGPPAALAEHFAQVPDYAPEHRSLFWYDWGPVFYRGRLDGTARLLAIASDPGPTERVVGRTLVGDAGQRVQGFLRKVGLLRRYVLVNAFAYAVHPSATSSARPLLADPAQQAWRNQLLDAVAGAPLQAIVAFGGNAQAALAQWGTAPNVPVFELPHPSAHDVADLLAKWRAAIPGVRAAVTPDPGGDQTEPNYGSPPFAEADYGRIPAADLPFGVPAWIGDDSRGRAAHPPRHNSVARSTDDPDHTLVWVAPTG